MLDGKKVQRQQFGYMRAEKKITRTPNELGKVTGWMD